LNFKIVCHLAELGGIPKFAENADVINILQLLLDSWLLTFIHRLGLAGFAESSKLAKMPIATNFHCLQKILHIKWNVLPL